METTELVSYINHIGDGAPLKDHFNAFFWSLMAFNLIVIALLQSYNPSHLRLLFSTAIHNRQLNNNLRENLNFRQFTSVLLNFTYFSSLGIIAWKATHSDVHYLLLIFAIILVLLALIKFLIISIVSVLANTRIGIQEHFLNHLIFYQIGGVILTPLLIFTHYIPDSYINLTLIILISIVCLFALVRELQSLVRALQYKISIFYIILYLCTLEILPLMVGFRVLTLNMGVSN